MGIPAWKWWWDEGSAFPDVLMAGILAAAMPNKVAFVTTKDIIVWSAYLARGLEALGFECDAWVLDPGDEASARETKAFRHVYNLTAGFDRAALVSSDALMLEGSALEEYVGERFLHRDAAGDRTLTGTNFLELPPIRIADRWRWHEIVGLAVHIWNKFDLIVGTEAPCALVGEMTLFAQHVIARLGHARSIVVIDPFSVAHHPGRLHMSNGLDGSWDKCVEQYRQYIETGVIPPEHESAAREVMERIQRADRSRAEYAPVSYYFPRLLDRFGPARVAKVLKMWWESRNEAGSSLSHKPYAELVHPVMRLRRKMRRRLLRKDYGRESWRSLPDQEFAVYFLHFQPEATVEGWAPDYQDQIAVIRNVVASLPGNMVLAVKEHWSQSGRDPSFYRELLSIPGVVVLHHTVSPYEAIQKCRVVVSLTGTVTLEAMCLGKPALVFGSVYYQHFAGVTRVASYLHLNELLANLDELPVATSGEAMAALAARHAASYRGSWNWGWSPEPDYSLGTETVESLASVIREMNAGVDGSAR